jgi:NADPH:quinone reductase-like Zn-dependent oxidoreductase
VTKGRGVDLILDIVGGDYIARDLVALAVEGRWSSSASWAAIRRRSTSGAFSDDV